MVRSADLVATAIRNAISQMTRIRGDGVSSPVLGPWVLRDPQVKNDALVWIMTRKQFTIELTTPLSELVDDSGAAVSPTDPKSISEAASYIVRRLNEVSGQYDPELPGDHLVVGLENGGLIYDESAGTVPVDAETSTADDGTWISYSPDDHAQ